MLDHLYLIVPIYSFYMLFEREVFVFIQEVKTNRFFHFINR